MRYAGLIKDDIVDCDDGICVSLWMQGCPHHCKGCHNPETWDFNGGIEKTRNKLIDDVISSLTQNGIKRNFSILGGEPLTPENIVDTANIIHNVRNKFKDIKIYLWTGYEFDKLEFEGFRNINNRALRQIKKDVDIVIDGPYKEELRDTRLLLRGSSNQRILYKGKDF
jgi:anaerobic ribonucleoside-triphosphate reductase activating protein